MRQRDPLPHQDSLAVDIDLVNNELLGEFVGHDVVCDLVDSLNGENGEVSRRCNGWRQRKEEQGSFIFSPRLLLWREMTSIEHLEPHIKRCRHIKNVEK